MLTATSSIKSKKYASDVDVACIILAAAVELSESSCGVCVLASARTNYCYAGAMAIRTREM